MQVSGRRKQKMQTVTLQDLSKTYSGGKEAVKGISLSLEQGEVFGFLGPNGAGKTTTVKLLNGMLAPTSGKCSVMGSDPAREPEKVHAVSGVLTEHARMYDNMTGLQNLVFYAAIFGIPEQEGQGMLLIEYFAEGQNRKNHYLYGTIPFKYSDYLEWYEKAGIYDMEYLNQNK